MKRIFWSLILAAGCYAQTYNGHGYVYYSLDRPDSASFADFMTVGGGGEGFLWKGLALTGDIGYMYPRRNMSDGIGLASVGGAWHFVDRKQPSKVVPFVTTGYTLAFRQGHANLMNLGGGVAWWFSKHVGLRTELRTYLQPGGYRTHFDTGLRFGLQFR